MNAMPPARPLPPGSMKTRANCCRCGSHAEITFPASGTGKLQDRLVAGAEAQGWAPGPKAGLLCPACAPNPAGRAAPPPAQTPKDRLLAALLATPRNSGHVGINEWPAFARKLADGIARHAAGDTCDEAAKAVGLQSSAISRWRRKLGVSRGGGITEAAIAAASDTPSLPKVIQMEATPPPPQPAGRVVTLRELTPAEHRAAILKLDEIFDDAAGRYVKDWDDARAAEALNIPRANLAAVREQYFGPVRSNPAADAAMEALARVEADLAEAKAAVAKIERRLAEVADQIAKLS